MQRWIESSLVKVNPNAQRLLFETLSLPLLIDYGDMDHRRLFGYVKKIILFRSGAGCDSYYKL